MKSQPESGPAKGFVLAAVSGLLLAFAFPRFDWAFLAWFAFLPLWTACRNRSPRRAALLGFTTGLVFYLIGLSWVTNTLTDYGHLHPAASWLVLVLLVAYLSAFPALFCWLLNRMVARNPLLFFLWAPVLWTSLEFLRSTPDVLGFSWLGLGYSQYASLPFIQIAEITGVYGVSALIVLVNAGLFVLSHPDFQKLEGFDRLRWPLAFITVGCLGACWGYGTWQLNRPAPAGPVLKLALIQPNISQSMKWDPRFAGEVMAAFESLTRRAAESQPDLVVWPEAATPFYFERDPAGTRRVRQLVRRTGVPLVFGSPARVPLPGPLPEAGGPTEALYNSAFLLDRQGRTLGRYDKVHLVPFGEFVPFRPVLFFVEKLTVGITDFARGDSFDVLSVEGHRFGVSICYEITFPDLVRRPVRDGAQFLVNITNDAWFGRSAASYQHIAMAALRAVENRAPVVRAANTGITGLIDASGKIRQATELFVQDVVVGEIHPRTGPPTIYAQAGDLFAWICLALAGILGFLAIIQRQGI